ncbi:uncharacterized protein MELLADRAFT_93955 [Melampsora larici-populina 98AG31]|uniref:Uncharacterized protein n=1 Tax=Melampsora larici-populina (strain 98AG31 / pathotype 3-4-7) TaxID=747676 RepID=F4S5W1_MELLP|nr:uncharacterized protein MELLADRAFT_93955 [Melampsora larici-populina 98AG31]EGF99969.1 hypothetical protein MELLADRAFT_93955 [Melampsora larici-populina 98AG31]
MTSFDNELKSTQDKLKAAGIKMKRIGSKENADRGEGTSSATTRSQSKNRAAAEVENSGETDAAGPQAGGSGEGNNTDQQQVEEADGEEAEGDQDANQRGETPEGNGGDGGNNEVQRGTREKRRRGGESSPLEEHASRGEGGEARRASDEETDGRNACMFEAETEPEEMSAQAKWWSAIEFAFETQQDELAMTMLQGFNLMYGKNEQTEAAVEGRTRRKRSPVRFRDERPRTQSLIVGEDDDEENEAENATAVDDVQDERGRDRRKKSLMKRRREDTSEERNDREETTKSKEVEENQGEEETEGGITYRIGKPLGNSSMLMPLTPYFENRMKTLKAYVPLTIFDLSWIERDQRAAGKKKVKTIKELQEDDSSATYSGLAPNEELLMTYGFWIDAFDLFIRYLREEYERPKAAKMFERHRVNVVKVKRITKCWMVALRYDMKVRMVTMKVKKAPGGGWVMEDAGYMHEDLLREAKEEADAKGERKFVDNPYAPGGGMEHVDPATGWSAPSTWGGYQGVEQGGSRGGVPGRGRARGYSNRGTGQNARGLGGGAQRAQGNGWFQGRGAGWWAKARGGGAGNVAANGKE